jgi:CRP-like cAMP-binding protein
MAKSNLAVQNDCTRCAMRTGRPFSGLSPDAAAALNKIKLTTTCPNGTVLFAQGERARGVFILRSGRAKLTAASPSGESVVVSVAKAGDFLGAGACLLGLPCEISAQTIERSEVSFVGRDDFVRFVDTHLDAAMHASICCETRSATTTR